MAAELTAALVAARLASLRESHQPMREAEARALMEPPEPARPFADQVASRLRELRALCELTRHLHRAAAVAQREE